MPNLVDEYKTIFLGYQGKPGKSSKTFSLYFSFLWFRLKSVKSPNRIFWAMEYRFKALKCQIWLTNTKPLFPLFWKRETNLETLEKRSGYIWVSYKFVFKSVKDLNRIFWTMQYWLKALKCPIWLTNTKPFFWESKANLETLQILSRYIWDSYKFVLTSVKKLNRIFWAIEYWLKALKWQICLRNTEPFFWESEADIETLQKLSPNIDVTYKLVLESGQNLSWL